MRDIPYNDDQWRCRRKKSCKSSPLYTSFSFFHFWFTRFCAIALMNNNPQYRYINICIYWSWYMRLVTYDYIFYGFENICYSRLNFGLLKKNAKWLYRERSLCLFASMNRFGRVVSSKVLFFFFLVRLFVFFTKSLLAATTKETTILLAQFECILHVTHFEFYCGEKKKKKKGREKKLNRTRTENHLRNVKRREVKWTMRERIWKNFTLWM